MIDYKSIRHTLLKKDSSAGTKHSLTFNVHFLQCNTYFHIISCILSEIGKTEITYTYLYASSAIGAFFAVMVMIGIICLVRRQSRSGYE